uniref:Phosphatidylserine synthase n=1 Tax=Piliocolobus tephrosceles TaxID=591936 RepID=A0A8C9HUA9_9PRIM
MPNMKFSPIENSYKEACNDINKLVEKLDVFVICHLSGYFVKGLALRNFFMLNIISVLFELIELKFRHILPNFYECWWDHILLDVLGCNLVGILLSLAYMKYYNIQLFDWKIPIKTKPRKKYIILPTVDRMLRKLFINSPSFLILIYCCVMANINDLNIFFLKAILQMQMDNILIYVREAITGIIMFNSCLELMDIVKKKLNMKNFFYFFTCNLILILEVIIILKFKYVLKSDKSDMTYINITWNFIAVSTISSLGLLAFNDYLM